MLRVLSSLVLVGVLAFSISRAQAETLLFALEWDPVTSASSGPLVPNQFPGIVTHYLVGWGTAPLDLVADPNAVFPAHFQTPNDRPIYADAIQGLAPDDRVYFRVKAVTEFNVLSPYSNEESILVQSAGTFDFPNAPMFARVIGFNFAP